MFEGKNSLSYVEQSETKRHGLVQKTWFSPSSRNYVDQRDFADKMKYRLFLK